MSIQEQGPDEKTLLLHSSVNYTDSNVTPLEERPPSLGIMYITVFISSLGFSVVLPTLWFYLQDIVVVLNNDRSFLGWVVAVYSLGQFAGSLVFGAWSQRRRTIEPLMVSLLISAAANVYYAVAEDIFPLIDRKWHLIVSRFLVGFGAGNVSLCRAFASEATTLSTRNQAMTIMGAAQGVGFVLGPAIGFGLTFVPTLHGAGISLDQYTSAGFASAFLILVNIAILPCTFRDLPGKVATSARKVKAKYAPGELFAMIFCIWVFFVILTGFSIFETITGPLTQHYLHFEDKQNGLLVLGAGVLSVLVFVVLGIITRMKWFSEHHLISYGLLMLSFAFVAINPWKGLPLVQLIIASCGIGLGYPIASTMTYALFSKVIAPKNQGDKMGFLTAAGSLARMSWAVWAIFLYDATPEPGFALFPVVAGLHLVTAVLFLIFLGRLGPHRDIETAEAVKG